mmetsp:Transcript_10207/g.23102  ORF Transcript_10207/g.23102 Transcript_10207/m.23102 type:complete len:222 (-) Transcript_10207:171-836(-)
MQHSLHHAQRLVVRRATATQLIHAKTSKEAVDGVHKLVHVDHADGLTQRLCQLDEALHNQLEEFLRLRIPVSQPAKTIVNDACRRQARRWHAQEQEKDAERLCAVRALKYAKHQNVQRLEKLRTLAKTRQTIIEQSYEQVRHHSLEHRLADRASAPRYVKEHHERVHRVLRSTRAATRGGASERHVRIIGKASGGCVGTIHNSFNAGIRQPSTTRVRKERA